MQDNFFPMLMYTFGIVPVIQQMKGLAHQVWYAVSAAVGGSLLYLQDWYAQMCCLVDTGSVSSSLQKQPINLMLVFAQSFSSSAALFPSMRLLILCVLFLNSSNFRVKLMLRS